MVKSISTDYSCDDGSEDVDVYSWFRGFYFLEVGNHGKCDGDECGVTWQIHANRHKRRDLTRIEMRNNPRNKDGMDFACTAELSGEYIKLEYIKEKQPCSRSLSTYLDSGTFHLRTCTPSLI
jgi:hypothetical protein